jgi:PAS domain S-box-containing protein
MIKSELFIENCSGPLCLIFELNPIVTVLSTVSEGIIIKANHAFFESSGYREDEAVGKSSIELGLWPDLKERRTFIQSLREAKKLIAFPVTFRRKDGELRTCLCSACLIQDKNQFYSVSTTTELSNQKLTREALAQRDKKILYQELQLSKIYTTLEVLLEQRNKEKVRIYEKISANLKNNISPFVEKIKEEQISSNARMYLDIISNNLEKIVDYNSGFETLSNYRFTRTESLIIDLIKQGKRSKEIANLLHVSTASISFHRNNIRIKLGLNKKKDSLSTYFHSKKY